MCVFWTPLGCRKCLPVPACACDLPAFVASNGCPCWGCFLCVFFGRLFPQGPHPHHDCGLFESHGGVVAGVCRMGRHHYREPQRQRRLSLRPRFCLCVHHRVHRRRAARVGVPRLHCLGRLLRKLPVCCPLPHLLFFFTTHPPPHSPLPVVCRRTSTDTTANGWCYCWSACWDSCPPSASSRCVTSC